MDKKGSRLRRSKRTRAHIRKRGDLRLTVHRTPRHIYAQIIEPAGNTVLTSSSIGKAIKAELKNGGNIAAAEAVGKQIAEQAVAQGITKVAFDRSGFKYHGRIKALADAAREGGLKF